ncbi:hypothetical protein BN85304160 [Paracholeplasma brassicae]|uniref:Uncharacterized protein n=1 Tax=Acholeplasma brassicae TaxID=61635 RepID=U4KMN4_9MOLU|nr:hypothetical protein [Paracholeplasma brassicae]CCV65437.1 hypothetical protein BN85304160 [Paracholeplasma brassicae]
MKKTLIFVLTLTVVLASQLNLKAAYNYAYWDQIASAESMHLLRNVDNSNIVDTNGLRNPITLGDLRDVFVYENKLYVSDATSNQIHIFNNAFEYESSLPEATDELGQLNSPQGIYVFKDQLYVSDYNNNRIAIFSLITKRLIQEVKNPNDVIFDNLEFKPLRVAVDRTGRMNVIAYNVFEGVMEFDQEGNFNRYFGTNTIRLSVLDALIYRFSTKEQRDKMALKLQSSFTSLDIDSDGYIYTASKAEFWQPVKKLNFKGRDVLETKGYVGVVGDAKTQDTDTRTTQGPSQIIDVTVHSSKERFSILDQNRGRIFTYDKEGNLLYISANKGSLQNELSGPTSIAYFDELIIVTDNISKSIKIFEPVMFASLVNEAVSSYHDMDYDKAKETWQEVLKLNSNYFLAYAGIGRAELREGNYKEAMKNLELGYDYYNYSKAYEQHRNNNLAIYLPYVLVGGFVLFSVGIVRSVKQAVKREGDE